MFTRLSLRFIIGLLLTGFGLSVASADQLIDPVEHAKRTTDAFASAALKAVGDITANVTDETAKADGLAVSMLVRGNKFVRLLGREEPLGGRASRPQGRFERAAFAAALNGDVTQVVRFGSLRTVVPLPFLAENCAVCHANYAEDFSLDNIIGAVSITTPLRRRR